jgi:hypothetical protein
MLQSLPARIGRIHSLRELWTDLAFLKPLPDWTLTLTSLAAIHIGETDEYSTPLSITTSPYLFRDFYHRLYMADQPTGGTLKLVGRQFKQISALILLLSSLKDLNLSENLIEEIDPKLARLVKLERLDMNMNMLRTLPPEIGALTALVHLNLCRNEIEFLPQNLFLCLHLVELKLSFNRLKVQVQITCRLQTATQQQALLCQVLPVAIGRLGSLKQLLADRNSIYFLPHTLIHLTVCLCCSRAVACGRSRLECSWPSAPLAACVLALWQALSDLNIASNPLDPNILRFAVKEWSLVCCSLWLWLALTVGRLLCRSFVSF